MQNWFAAALISIVPAAPAIAGHGLHPPIPFFRMTIVDAKRTKTSGTGCIWSDQRNDTFYMSLQDDRAAVRRSGGDVMLIPAKGAKDLFPFTFDRWQAGGILIALQPYGRLQQTGSESMETPSRLTLSEGGIIKSWDGILSCGS